jgi:hypothetical protein
VHKVKERFGCFMQPSSKMKKKPPEQEGKKLPPDGAIA